MLRGGRLWIPVTNTWTRNNPTTAVRGFYLPSMQGGKEKREDDCKGGVCCRKGHTDGPPPHPSMCQLPRYLHKSWHNYSLCYYNPMKHAWILQESQTSTTKNPQCIQIAKRGAGGGIMYRHSWHTSFTEMATVQNASSQSPFPQVQRGLERTWAERGPALWQAAINLEQSTLGAVRLDLNGAWPAKRGQA